jgi:hypothetical protein
LLKYVFGIREDIINKKTGGGGGKNSRRQANRTRKLTSKMTTVPLLVRKEFQGRNKKKIWNIKMTKIRDRKKSTALSEVLK